MTDGRWPTNLILDPAAALQLDREVGPLSSHKPGTQCGRRDAAGRCLGHGNAGKSTSGETFHGPEVSGGSPDSGGPSRFFNVLGRADPNPAPLPPATHTTAGDADVTQPHYRDDAVTLYAGDALDVLRTLPDNSVDSVVTDPPAGIGFMGKTWDDHKGGREAWSAWLAAIMGEALRVTKPGGHALVWALPRTAHWTACALEDAGWDIRDRITHLQGAGFPKSLNVSAAIDRAAGATREVVGTKLGLPGYSLTDGNGDHRTYQRGLGNTGTGAAECAITAPATDAARQWDGWGTALKPSGEDWYCARKPFSPVPSWVPEARRLHHALGALLWLSLTPAKRAELTSPSSPHALPEATCVSVLAAAAMSTSPDASDATATYSSPAVASTSSSIASSWSAILAALSAPTTTSTTSTASSTTTALRTLNSLLAPLTSPTTMPACGCLTAGPWLTAASAGDSSSGRWRSWLSTLTATAPASASEPIARAVASALADTAASLSGDSAAAGSSADGTATTPGAPHAEDWWLARKPLSGTVAANVVRWGTGALNVDGCRVGSTVETWPTTRSYGGDPSEVAFTKTGGGVQRAQATGDAPAGRWPTNAVLDSAAAQQLDRETGPLHTQDPATRRSVNATGGSMFDLPGMSDCYQDDPRSGASRYFPTFAPPDPLPAWRYEPKAPTHERPRVKADGGGNGRVTGLGGKVRQCNVCETRAIESGAGEPSCGHGDYRWEVPTTEAIETVAHPTVKPLDLIRWLARLITPPGGTVLDCFAGSGTTGEAAVVEGFRAILVEREAAYLPLIVARLTKPIQPDLFGGVA